MVSPPRPEPTTTGITIYGCGPDEAALFREAAPRHGVRPRFVEASLSAANADLARGHRCVSVDHKAQVTRATLEQLSRAGVVHVSTRSVGRDHIDARHAQALGIAVETVAYSPDSVADYTLMLMLMVLRDAKSVLQRAADHDYRLGPARGRELRDLTVGVVGTGRIGTAVVSRLRGFGCRILAHDRLAGADVEYVGLETLLRHSDIVTLHTPLDASTHHLLDRERIARLKAGAIVVNTARGALIDTDALVVALESGALGGAALDVLEGEKGVFYADCRSRPVGDNLSRLQLLPNVLISPHTAFYTDHALRDVVESTLVSCVSSGNGARSGE